jgi:hypothetical protein
MTLLAGGFKVEDDTRRCNSEKQKKAGEARNPRTLLSSPRSVINPPRQSSGASSHGTSSRGRPAETTGCTQDSHTTGDAQEVTR